MLNRRKFIAATASASVLAATQASAHVLGQPYVLPEEYTPRIVRVREEFIAGELYVDPNQFAIYWTLGESRAMRFTVGIGRAGLYHSGEFYVGRKQEWPDWRPTPAMIKRDPDAYLDFAEGGIYENGPQPGGISNPLGARALYLYNVNTRRDTYLRIHGTNNPRTIGRAVSNGCARLINPQVEELYAMVPNGTRVVLFPKAGAGPSHSSL